MTFAVEMRKCWCGGPVGPREPGDEHGLGCLADINHIWVGPPTEAHCEGCGAPTNPRNPRSSHCQKCPPWPCPTCGEMCTVDDLCGCWISLDGMALADIKGLFARGGLGIEVPER